MPKKKKVDLKLKPKKLKKVLKGDAELQKQQNEKMKEIIKEVKAKKAVLTPERQKQIGTILGAESQETVGPGADLAGVYFKGKGGTPLPTPVYVCLGCGKGLPPELQDVMDVPVCPVCHLTMVPYNGNAGTPAKPPKLKGRKRPAFHPERKRMPDKTVLTLEYHAKKREWHGRLYAGDTVTEGRTGSLAKCVFALFDEYNKKVGLPPVADGTGV